MRGYCPACKEFRSDVGEDAWAIVWKNGNPICERCGGFVDVNYFVELKNKKQAVNFGRKDGNIDRLRGYGKSGVSRGESERKNENENGRVDECHPSNDLTPSPSDIATFIYTEILLKENKKNSILYIIASPNGKKLILSFAKCWECPNSFFKLIKTKGR